MTATAHWWYTVCTMTENKSPDEKLERVVLFLYPHQKASLVQLAKDMGQSTKSAAARYIIDAHNQRQQEVE